ncbi:choline/carnitine O-acyltransferase [Sporosarcina sp. HYO08]|uniref:choline/carnitine O-acyltransferase n=1 Tax=Sporosarcina sp. HYO08 TaxID=1759557 RepID=UPI00079325A6|nr:choline/carnitine O-acyltransferase [Sporosarcina sp. HYO08]KXH78566.1 hypothetical protein AU377_12870 [Sporosarcina sp. HYO08]
MKKTFTYQNELPTLPIPPLEMTKSKLLEWIEPLVSVDQYKQTTKVIERFFVENGEAEKLQEKLLEWQENRSGSWLKPFWDDLYLKHRDSLPSSMNFNVLLTNNHKERYALSEMIGQVCYLSAQYYHMIIDEEIEPAIVRGMPLDMSQYKKFFRSVRIPRPERDEIFVAEYEKKNNHVILLYQNNVYKIDVTNEEGDLYPGEAIAKVIEEMFRNEREEGVNVGIFTTAKRDQAAKAYDKLKLSKVNAKTLQTIADALVVISIDEKSENAEEAIQNLMLHEDNKYFDKTIQIIITKAGKLGFNIEHSAVDGTSIYSVIRHISKGLKKDPSPQLVQLPAKPNIEKQQWELTQELQDLFIQFHEDHEQRKKRYFLHSQTFMDFGAEKIKSLRFSPDAFFHIALQVAQYRTFGEFRSVYEPVATRYFYEGRTECARATSMEKSRFVEALDDRQETVDRLYALMNKAGAAHSARIHDCQKGFGVERHMYGLEKIYHLFGAELGIPSLPEIFKDEGYVTLRHDSISTSGMAYDNVKYRMFAPVVKGGFGVAYILLENSMSINISSHMEDKHICQQLMRHLIDALHELRTIADREQ